MLDKAKFFVVSEIAEVSNEPVKSVDERVDKSLERCFASKARAAAAAASRAKKTTKTAKASTRSSSRRTSRAVRAS